MTDQQIVQTSSNTGQATHHQKPEDHKVASERSSPHEVTGTRKKDMESQDRDFSGDDSRSKAQFGAGKTHSLTPGAADRYEKGDMTDNADGNTSDSSEDR